MMKSITKNAHLTFILSFRYWLNEKSKHPQENKSYIFVSLEAKIKNKKGLWHVCYSSYDSDWQCAGTLTVHSHWVL